MAVKNDITGAKIPALSELVGEIIPFSGLFDKRGKSGLCEGMKLWRRPYDARGNTEDIVLVSTEVASDLLEISAQTLSTWAKETPGLRVAYGWWSSAALMQKVLEKARLDQRGYRQ